VEEKYGVAYYFPSIKYKGHKNNKYTFLKNLKICFPGTSKIEFKFEQYNFVSKFDF